MSQGASRNEVVIAPAQTSDAVLAERVRRCVQLQEMLERYAPLVLLLLVAGGPVIYLLVRAGGVTGRVLIGGFLAWLAAGLTIAVVTRLILAPMRFVRYRLAARSLKRCVEQAGYSLATIFSWSAGSPGAFGVATCGTLIVASRSTGFRRTVVAGRDLLAVRVEREAESITRTTQGGGSAVAFGGAGWALAFMPRTRSTSVTRTVEYVNVEVIFALAELEVPRTLVIPFGRDRHAAYETCAMLQSLATGMLAMPIPQRANLPTMPT